MCTISTEKSSFKKAGEFERKSSGFTGNSVELFILTSALGFETAGILIICAVVIFSSTGAFSLSAPFSTNAKAPTDESGVLLYAKLEERRSLTESSVNESGGRWDDRDTLRHITDKNEHNKINNLADFKFMVITEVFFKKINSFLLIYIDFYVNLCDNILVMVCHGTF